MVVAPEVVEEHTVAEVVEVEVVEEEEEVEVEVVVLMYQLLCGQRMRHYQIKMRNKSWRMI